jgi:two-component system, cell cycle response regulator DivK
MAKILIREDDAVMTRMYKRVFEYEGFEVHMATDGASGLRATKELKPDLVLLDIMMPQMSGMQVLDAMKGDPVTEQIPVMVFTNLAGKQDAETVLGMGAVTCIHKSEVNPKQVAQMVRDELARRGVELPPPGLQVLPEAQNKQTASGEPDLTQHMASQPQQATTTTTQPAQPAGVQPVQGATTSGQEAVSPLQSQAGVQPTAQGATTSGPTSTKPE